MIHQPGQVRVTPEKIYVEGFVFEFGEGGVGAYDGAVREALLWAIERLQDELENWEVNSTVEESGCRIKLPTEATPALTAASNKV